MSARRSLFVMVGLAISLLVISLILAFNLQKVVRITNSLITVYAALDQWQQGALQGLPISSDELASQADIIELNLPTIMTSEPGSREQLLGFLRDNPMTERTLASAQVLNEKLVAELFECHRLQNYYSSWVNIIQIALTVLMLSVGFVSYFMGRRAQDYRLAPFPEANPNPVFGLNARGDVIYTNDAVDDFSTKYFGKTDSPADLLPPHFKQRLIELRRSKLKNDVWVHTVADRIFQYKVQLLSRYDRIHVYTEDITEQEMIRSRNAFIAYHDPVTLLANREKLVKVVDELADSSLKLTLVMIYTDGISKVLSTQGLKTVDQFAREYSMRLREASYSIMDNDRDDTPLVIRFDTNLFGCLYYRELSLPEHEKLSQALSDCVVRPFMQGEREFFFNSKSGAACMPSSGPVRELIQKANLALHFLNDSKKTYQLFDDAIEAEMHSTHLLEQALRHALELHEVAMHYQPQQDLATGSLIGFEALMRWQREGRNIPPGYFIPIAERTGLIHNLGHWALRDVLRQVKEWQQDPAKKVGGIVAVNVSAPEFGRSDFITDIQSAIADFDINPAFIQLEITESLLIEDEKVAIDRMHQLKALGFTLAIDDFGTGYSSFSYLSRFPVDKLKIDRSFIVNMNNGPRDQAIVAAMIDVAHQLGIVVIAEGVETETEKAMLKNMGCDQLQGYLYGRPMPANKVTRFAQDAVEIL